MLKTARKFDIDDALMDEVFKQSSWAELTQNEGNLPVKLMTRNIVEAQSELRLPFKHCWLEFSGTKFNEHMESLGWAGGYVGTKRDDESKLYRFERVGVLLTELHDGQIDAYCFHNIAEINEIYMSMLARSFKT